MVWESDEGIYKRFCELWEMVNINLPHHHGINVGKLSLYFLYFIYSRDDTEFSYRFDTSDFKLPAIFLFREGRYEIYNGTKTAGSISKFAKEYSLRLTKFIPNESDYSTCILNTIKKSVAPLLLLTNYLGLGELPSWLCIVISLIILFLPLILLGCICLSITEEGNVKEPIRASTIQKYKRGDLSSAYVKNKTSFTKPTKQYKRSVIIS